MYVNNTNMKKKIFNFLAMTLVGVLNGLFTSGAGQILVFFYIYILKMDSKEAREKSLITIPIISIVTMLFYIRKSNIDLLNIVLIIIIAIITGQIGNIIMKKINSNLLNTLSGVFLLLFSVISLWRIIL